MNAYRPDIDGLRAFAVLAVVVYHAFPVTFESGFIGVDVFFVISGYLISGIILNDLKQGTFSLWNFYSRRIRRIFPALIVVLAAALIFGWFALFPNEYRALGKHVFGGATFISNFLLWEETGYFDFSAKAKPLLHLWSLGIEEQFYIVFPLLLWCCAKKHLRIATVIIVLGVLSFLGNLYCMPDPTVNFYNPLARAWELMAGAALCVSMRQGLIKTMYMKSDAQTGEVVYGKEHENLNLALALLGVVLLICALWLVRGSRPYPGWQAILPVLGTMLLIVAGPMNLINKHLLGNRFAVFTGLVSYPLYLWHWVLISYAFIINGGLDESTRLLRVELIAASFVLAVLTNYLVEKPIRFSTRARTVTIYALIFIMFVIGTAGLSIQLMDGLPDRRHITHYIDPGTLKPLPEEDNAGWAYTGLAKSSIDYCRFTDVGSDYTIALLGDSYAWAAYPGVAEVNKTLGINTALIAHSLPHPVLAGITSLIRDKNIRNQYDKPINEALNVVLNRSDIRKVFIVLRVQLLINRKEYTASEIKNCIQDTVNVLINNGKSVYIVYEPPDATGVPSRRPFIKRALYTSKDSILQKTKQYLDIMNEINGAEKINVLDKFCPQNECPTYSASGIPLYFDGSHLSTFGSTFLANEILFPYLNDSPK